MRYRSRPAQDTDAGRRGRVSSLPGVHTSERRVTRRSARPLSVSLSDSGATVRACRMAQVPAGRIDSGMERRELGTTGFEVSAVGLGTWNIGGSWGPVSDEEGREAVRAALDAGIDFLDTADVYGDGRSERHIRDVLEESGYRVVLVAPEGTSQECHVCGTDGTRGPDGLRCYTDECPVATVDGDRSAAVTIARRGSPSGR